MGDKTKIEWTDATWNPVTGCTKVSAGCKFCYAERDFHRPYPGRAFTDVRTHPNRLLQPLRWRRQRRIFVDSMGDLFHEDVRVPFIDQCFAVMALASRHTFQVLTKRPERMRNYFDLSYVTDFPLEPIGSQVRIAYSAGKIHEMFLSKGKDLPLGYSLNQPYQNVWLGVSVEDQQTADERIPLLLQTKAAVRFVSYEPALGPVDFNNIELLKEFDLSRTVSAHVDALTEHDDEHFFNQHAKLDWVIAGGESGRNARPSHPDWFRAVRDQCQAAGVPFFFKQWGEWNPTKNSNVVRPSDAGKLSRYTVACSTVREEIGQTVYHAYPSVPQDGIGIYERLEQVGKKRAGRMLDGREWNEFPQ